MGSLSAASDVRAFSWCARARLPSLVVSSGHPRSPRMQQEPRPRPCSARTVVSWCSRLSAGDARLGHVRAAKLRRWPATGAALQLLMGNYERSGDATASDVASKFTVRNFTATDVAQVWEQPYKDHSNGGSSGFYPITIASKNHDGEWMDRGVDSEFDGFHVRRSNAVGRPTDGRPPIGCINTTWLSARAALFLPVPCNPVRLWRLRGRVDVDATNRSACSATGLGGAGAGLQINCGSLPPPGRQ